MPILFSDPAWDDYEFWAQTDRKKLERINKLIKASLRTPFSGIGKPEPLKLNLQGFWSRRIDNEHRLVYSYDSGTLSIVSCKYHY